MKFDIIRAKSSSFRRPIDVTFQQGYFFPVVLQMALLRLCDDNVPHPLQQDVWSIPSLFFASLVLFA